MVPIGPLERVNAGHRSTVNLQVRREFRKFITKRSRRPGRTLRPLCQACQARPGTARPGLATPAARALVVLPWCCPGARARCAWLVVSRSGARPAGLACRCVAPPLTARPGRAEAGLPGLAGRSGCRPGHPGPSRPARRTPRAQGFLAAHAHARPGVVNEPAAPSNTYPTVISRWSGGRWGPCTGRGLTRGNITGGNGLVTSGQRLSGFRGPDSSIKDGSFELRPSRRRAPTPGRSGRLVHPGAGLEEPRGLAGTWPAGSFTNGHTHVLFSDHSQ